VLRFIVRRILGAIPVLFGLSVIDIGRDRPVERTEKNPAEQVIASGVAHDDPARRLESR
jgi:hypothetical protein